MRPAAGRRKRPLRGVLSRPMAHHAGHGRYLAIYLNDHLAGAAGGLELARRLRASNGADPEMGEPLARLCAEIEADRETLTRLTERLGIRRDPVKPALARFAERLGRLKPNGHLRGYSPLSRVLELEILASGIGGKLQLWNALEQTFGSTLEGFDFHASGRARRPPGSGSRRPAHGRCQTGFPGRSRGHRGRPLVGERPGRLPLLGENRLGERGGLRVRCPAGDAEQRARRRRPRGSRPRRRSRRAWRGCRAGRRRRRPS